MEVQGPPRRRNRILEGGEAEFLLGVDLPAQLHIHQDLNVPCIDTRLILQGSKPFAGNNGVVLFPKQPLQGDCRLDDRCGVGAEHLGDGFRGVAQPLMSFRASWSAVLRAAGSAEAESPARFSRMQSHCS